MNLQKILNLLDRIRTLAAVDLGFLKSTPAERLQEVCCIAGEIRKIVKEEIASESVFQGAEEMDGLQSEYFRQAIKAMASQASTFELLRQWLESQLPPKLV